MLPSAAPTVRLDAVEYEAVAKSFLLRWLTNLIDQADPLGVIQLGPDCQLSEDDLNRLFPLAFTLLATLEDHGGFKHDGRSWFHCTLFTTSLPATGATFQYLGSTARTALHANVDDEILQAAATVCARRPTPTT